MNYSINNVYIGNKMENLFIYLYMLNNINIYYLNFYKIFKY